MSEIITGYLNRSSLVEELKARISDESHIPVSDGSNQGYEIGKRLGYVDALKEVVELVKTLPDEQKPKGKRKIYGDPRTFRE